MTNHRSCVAYVAILAAACYSGMPALSQQVDAAASPFSRSLQVYLGGDAAAAQSSLDLAMRHDANDPRLHYLRALCLLRQGQRAGAREEMLVGAELEARAQDAYAVDQSLAQVPIAERLWLNEYRWRAGVVRAVTQPENDDREIIRPVATDAAVLRQRVAVRLDQLVRPVSLNELVEQAAQQLSPAQERPIETGAKSEPAAAAVEPSVTAEAVPTRDPFVDDQPSNSEGTVPSGKLIGILGRVLRKSTPTQSIDALREKMPALPLPSGSGSSSPDSAMEPGTVEVPQPAGDDPFADPTLPSADPPANDHGTSDDEDPFG